MLRLSNGWFPNFTNAEELLEQNGGGWENAPAPKIEGRSDKEAYADMPKKLVDYVKSLPEFDAGIFEKITEMVAA